MTGLRRRPRRKALIVGVNYTGPIKLMGSVNDAHLFALTLLNLFEFTSSNIVLLTDGLPDEIFLNEAETRRNGEGLLTAHDLPNRCHIVAGLKWLAKGAMPGDVLVFYFAGHGVQIDDLSGWEGAGYDECILPVDCYEGGHNINALAAVSIRQILMAVEQDVQVSIFLDCTGGQTMLDPAGTGSSWTYIKGIKQKGIWPFFTDPTDKMERARYNRNVWSSESMKKKDVRPRFHPGCEVSNASECYEPFTNGVTSTKAHAFLIAAAPFDQVAIEARLPSLGLRAVSPTGKLGALSLLPSNKPIIHGVFTWSLVRAMSETLIAGLKNGAADGDKRVTFAYLVQSIKGNLALLREKHGLSKLNQTCDLTFFRPSGSDTTDLLFYPLNGKSKKFKFSDATDPEILSLPPDAVCLPRRQDFTNGYTAEISLMAKVDRFTEETKFWKNHQTKLHRDWELHRKKNQNDHEKLPHYQGTPNLLLSAPAVTRFITSPQHPTDPNTGVDIRNDLAPSTPRLRSKIEMGQKQESPDVAAINKLRQGHQWHKIPATENSPINHAEKRTDSAALREHLRAMQSCEEVPRNNRPDFMARSHPGKLFNCQESATDNLSHSMIFNYGINQRRNDLLSSTPDPRTAGVLTNRLSDGTKREFVHDIGKLSEEGSIHKLHQSNVLGTGIRELGPCQTNHLMTNKHETPVFARRFYGTMLSMNPDIEEGSIVPLRCPRPTER